MFIIITCFYPLNNIWQILSYPKLSILFINIKIFNRKAQKQIYSKALSFFTFEYFKVFMLGFFQNIYRVNLGEAKKKKIDAKNDVFAFFNYSKISKDFCYNNVYNDLNYSCYIFI